MRRRPAVALLLVTLLSACDRGATPGGGTAGGAPQGGRAVGATPAAPAGPASPLMQPFQGRWNFDFDKTVAQWRADGVPEFEVSQLPTIARAIKIHHDMTIAGDAAVLHGTPEGSYDFFALHPHGRWTCGKAWLHQDRHDPGDMTKCYARLELKDDGRELHLSTRMNEDPPDPADPETATTPPAAGSAASCAADGEPHPPWTPFRTYVFVRG